MKVLLWTAQAPRLFDSNVSLGMPRGTGATATGARGADGQNGARHG